MSKDKFVAFREAVLALLRLCKEHKSGAMYVYADKGHGAVFSINKGEIMDLYYRNVRGVEALQDLRNVESARFFFKGDRDPGNNPSTQSNNTGLSTEEIFKQLGVDFNEELGGGLAKILVIDDSGLARKSIIHALNGREYRIVEAKDGVEALTMLRLENPDLVLLDLILPKMDGYEVLARMKKDERQKDIPVIVLTSRDTLFDKLKGKMSGTDEYLTKPFQPAELLQKIDKYLG
ncbi:MAG: response regulator [Gammaproteobacteria bacterium]|nr:response regulator [Gammaproteobacteria bacterium]MDH5800716.1 response regulator [Gammaproteobacteria bacterium]